MYQYETDSDEDESGSDESFIDESTDHDNICSHIACENEYINKKQKL
jgi:hypothetical protein